MGLSIWHLIVVLVIALIIFGTKKLRDVGGDLGGAIRNFKQSMKENEEEPPAADKDKPANPANIEKKPATVIEGKVTAKSRKKKT